MLRCVISVASVLCLCLTLTNQATEDGLVSSNVAFRFTSQLYNVSIPENSVAKTYAVQSPGSPRMGVQVAPNTFTDIRYKIVEGDKDRFFKAEHRLVGDFCFLFIRIKTGNNDVLNRERNDNYILQIRATASFTEGNQKVHYSTDTTVVVSVLDTNDFSPLFHPNEYNATVAEDTPLHQSIVKVIAVDADLGRNGEIYYFFAEDTDKFAIHPVTGIITLTRPLLYNEGSYHELRVHAVDRGMHSQSGLFSQMKPSTAMVRIRVKKVNLYAPEIRIRRHPSIVENSNADIYAIVNVNDRDEGIHGQIDKLEIVDGDPDGHFRIRPSRQKGEYNIEVLKLLDREQTPQGYKLQLRAVDKGIPPRESYKSVPVQLADLNDNAPVFNKEIYEVKVQESAPINTPLIRLKVTDQDEGRNAQVFLEIVGGNEHGEFYINAETGMLYTAVHLDTETKPSYSLTVSAIDQGNVGTRKQSSAKVKITVEDTNDNDPIFAKSEMTVWIDENLPAGSSVTKVTATDKDRGENAYISYLIANLNHVPFEVDHFSGLIRTTQLLDYESMRREYVLRIRASDWGQPYRRQTEMQVTVKVRDINDNRPQFEKIDCVGNLPRHTPIGTEIITLSAIDFDSGNIISYRIVSGSEDNCFSIDSTSGTITVACDLNDVRVNERELNVTATDNTHFADIVRVRFKLVNTKKNQYSSGRLLSDDTGLFDCKDTGVARRLTEVLAEAENNNGPLEKEDFPMMPTRYGQNVHSPEFIDFPIEIKVNESVPIGSILVKLKARDRDLGYNGELVYGISGGDSHSQFDVDMKTGELKIIGYLDREKEYEYFLNITVYDLGKPQKSCSKVLPITVLDVNDNAPKFEKALASYRVTENALNGTAIFRANATDLDEGDNAKVTYSLATDTSDFTVDNVTGVLSVSNTLDRERQDLYELRIRATDNGGKGPDNPPLFSEAIVRISIDDINDNPPRFSLPNYNVKAREDVPVGTVVAIVTASDPDLGPDGEVQYYLEDADSDGTFKIDKLSGTIRTTKYLDFEERQVHSLKVTAYDRGNPSLSSDASVIVNVVDVNENAHAPSFGGERVLTGSVRENMPIGTVVMNVSAKDEDPPGGDSNVEYSIRDGDGIGLFSIDNKGCIKTTAILDIETKDHYWLTVFAQDHGIVPLFSSVEVYIEVINENDNVPLSEYPVYYPVIQEDSPAGTIVLQINATDRDKDPTQKISYKITSGNPETFFAINSSSGVITTTARKLDRESLDEHILELMWKDASLACKKKGMILACLDTIEKHKQFLAALERHFIGDSSHLTLPASYWIGGFRDLDDFAKYQWENGNIVSSYGWLMGETRSPYTYCLKFDPYIPGWHDASCDDLYNYVCMYGDLEEGTKNTEHINKDTDRREIHLEENKNVELRESITEVPKSLTLWRLHNHHPNIQGVPTNDEEVEEYKKSINSPKHKNHFKFVVSTDEVLVSDNGNPPLSSTTRVVVKVGDINDNAPEFEQAFYSVTIPATGNYDRAMFQNDARGYLVDDFDGADAAVELEPWESHGPSDFKGLESVLRVLAFDRDIGSNAEIRYQIKSGKGRNKFKIDNTTGMVYAQKGFEPGQEYELNIKAIDSGTPQRSNICKVSVKIVPVPESSKNAPVVKPPSPVQLTEGDNIGFLASLIQATDADNDTLWYDIVDGDPRLDFYIGRDTGNILLAHKLDHELQREYILNISVTDTVHTVYTTLNVSVIDINDHRPEFTEKVYKQEISESVSVDREILTLKATDKDENDKLIFSFYSAENALSLKTFKLDSITGVITLATNLDRETLSEHILTVMVRDAGTPAKKNLARVHVIVHDYNDHTPHFSDKILVGKVYETASVGSVVLKALAVDHDKGDNARITYSIISGNVGNVFNIDPNLGTISIARELDISSASEYTLHIKATDHGQPPLSSTVPAHISLTMADNDPPRFVNKEIAAEIYEDQSIGSYVAHLDVRSTSSLQFEILEGNSDDSFIISPSTGVITTQKYLDYETNKFYNLSVIAINMASVSAKCNVIIHILDRNDNAPQFLQFQYYGIISEAALEDSLILTNSSEPLVIKALDADSERNALLQFDIVEILPRRYFQIDSNTGAIRTLRRLDYETMPLFTFHVQVSDLGKPKLFSDSTAKVVIQVTDINDCPPVFTSPIYNVTLLLPSYKDIAVIQVNATDPDSTEGDPLKYDIIEGNKLGIFKINSYSGVITLVDPEHLKPSASYKLHVRVSDGKFSSVAKVYIRVDESDNSGLVFQKPFYQGSIVENSTKITPVCVVNVLGSVLNENIEFRILNPTDMFTIGITSGVIRTTGIRFDREEQDSYHLIVEARSNEPYRERPRVAHVVVNVTILDINDNCPMFVNLPYYAVVSVDDDKGSVITKVLAIDRDSLDNGEVRYELIRGHGELFKVQRETGDIEIKQKLESHNKEYELLIAAYDKGITPCRTDVTVHIKVIDRSMPVFKKQFYSESVPENVELHSPLSVSIEAESPLNRKLIYSIVRGNELEEFALDFNTAPDSNNGPCVISVVDELDYEQTPQYELLIRATDSVSGAYAEVPVSIVLTDVNDCPPEFTEESYNISVSEAAQFGTQILTVLAHDNDTKNNQEIVYSIQKSKNNNATDYFYIDDKEGKIFLKQSLDHEMTSEHHFIVVATDKGVPSLSSTAHVWVKVLDMNDNAPRFELSSYSCGVSVSAKRDQFVTIMKASDLDDVDKNNLKYTIVEGNEQQTFSMDSATGIISLVNLANFGNNEMMILNVSVSDGVYTNFARLKVELLPANLHIPKFNQDVVKDVAVPENRMAGLLVTVVNATDLDFGEFGIVSYSIPSDLLNEAFSIDKNNGKIITKISLDREKQKLYEIPIMATDGGGLSDFMTVRVHVTDENDNAPRFLLKEYKITVPSNLTTGITFAKIKATDADEGSAAQLEYSIYEKKSSDVTKLFGINPSTGEFFLISNVYSYIGEVFQFFVRATDKGRPEKHSDVPVNILIIGPNDIPPSFEKSEGKFFLPENSATGTLIAKLKMVSNLSVNFEIVSDSTDNPQFAIDSQGQLTLARPLNFEGQPSHVIGVLALTDSSPPLTALAEIILQVQDENDHDPQFESNTYVLNLAENVPEGSSIMRVIAHDKDQGGNGEVRYNFTPDNTDIVNYFGIDAHTGWITNLVKLNREEKAEYKFYVIATDNGTPKHSTRTTVIIKLKDYNDSPTLFKETTYEAEVNEDALPGTVLLTLTTIDLDKNLTTPVYFYIIKGDPSLQFQVRQTGELYVAKELDREKVDHYNLEILVTDGLFTHTTEVSITVLDANDNPPFCLKYRYRQVLSEGILPGSFVLTVLANDIDGPEHSKLKYVLAGEGSESFFMDKDTGDLKTVMHLDRENQSKYSLTAHVHDKEHIEWECSSQIELIISDLNDNPPVFSLPYYSVALPEDVEVGTLVTKIHAFDADIGINRKIKYSFIDSFNDHFVMAHDSGIVTLAKPLDREIRALYNLTVQAVDQGTPQLSSVTNLIVNVQDINDNPPEFENKYYFATVPEIDAVGTEVVRVQATSKDIGANAEVYYSIIGGNEHKKFAINNKTGFITIADMLDFERAKDYFLTIQAIDGGEPPLSNLATVNITVTDCNDNAPVFTQVSYSTRISENAPVDAKVIEITATDLDSDDNGRVTYSIISGDNLNQFAIGQTSGYVRVAAPLDRESISSYSLEILAKDSGIPVLSRQTLLTIDIADFNDNPPIFSQSNYTAIIQENKPIGYSILQFEITDDDIPPNTSPYTFDIRLGNEGNYFRLDQDGVLRTAAKFNHKIRNNYLLQIRVFDNGSPPLYSDSWVLIKVIEESQYPPIFTPLDININSYLDEYPGGVIGKVYANDQDQYDTLTYSLHPTIGIAYPTHELFQINKSDGTLSALPRLDIGEYRLNVSVTDGKFSTYTIVKINVQLLTDVMLDNSVGVRFRAVSPQSFILSHKKGFVKAVKNAMNCKLKDVIIISVQPSDDEDFLRVRRYVNQTLTRPKRYLQKDLDVLFTVRKPDEEFYSSDTIRKSLNDNLEELEESTKLVVEEIIRPKCNNKYCTYGVCQDHFVLDTTVIGPVSTDVTSFVSPRHKHKLDCMCKQGYAGDRCDTIVNECARDPCPIFKICVPDASQTGYSCQCPEGYAGAACDVDISKCHDQNCYIARNPISFSGKSYSQYRIINKKSIEDQLSLSLRVRTVQPTGNIMYAAGKVDYNILEIVNGGVQYRFELGSGEGIVRVGDVYVADGHWHEVKLERDRNNAKITIDGIYTAQGSAPGISDILNLQSDEMYLGAEVHQHPSILGFEDVQKGFTGCMDDVRISRVSVPLHKSGENSIVVLKRFANVEFSCDSNDVLKPPGPCGSQPCLNGGTCVEIKSGYKCECHSRFTGTLCELDTDPCASAPCLYGGKCTSTIAGDFVCDCVLRLSGKRCEYGRYCSPNPCKHGGVCEEGDDGPLCKCRSFAGEFCEYDLNECESNPCQNGGTCINEIGSFHCICPSNVTGTYCANSIFNSPISTAFFTNITLKQLIYCVAALVGFALFISLLICWICYCIKKTRKKKRSRNNGNIKDNNVLNSTQNHRPHELSEFKRVSKLSNLEVNHREPICAARPVSYTPSSQNDGLYNNNAALMINNLDTLRSYGSAGDELEIAPDYGKNLNRSTPQGCISNHCDTEKLKWNASTIGDKSKLKTDYKVTSPVNNDMPNRLYGGRSNANPHNVRPTGTSTFNEEDQRNVGSYHWDCSDWARHSQTLPNITEVPSSEIPDSSSFHSNESNESRCANHVPHSYNHKLLGGVSPLNEVDVEYDYGGDVDEGSRDLNGLNSLSGDGSSEQDYRFATADSYIRHPNSYLPTHSFNIPSEAEAESLQSPGSDDVEPYGFPSNHNRRKHIDDDMESVITTLAEERHSLLGGCYQSNSDMSTNLCDIEDSECETEQKPLNYMTGRVVHQTDV